MNMNVERNLKERVREVLLNWFVLLTSGNYEQGRGYLAEYCNEDSWNFCCLGVLCISQHPKLEYTMIEEWELMEDTEGKIVWPNCLSKAFWETHVDTDKLPHKLQEAIKNRSFGYTLNFGDQNTWATLNDAVGLTFEEIAKVLSLLFEERFGEPLDNYTGKKEPCHCAS